MASTSDFLIDRMCNAGIKHVFGLPGDYVLDFYATLWHSPKIEVINTTDENHAGFAADAYARVNGIGCVCVTYNVGALKIANAVACAYAERSPLVVISGSPGMKERDDGFLLHHMVRSFNCQKEIFEKITCMSVILDNPSTAGYHIDRAFEALKHYKQPIYIELPRDVAKKPITYDVYNLGTPKGMTTDPQNLAEAIEEVSQWISKAKNPVILAGVELARYGLGEKLIKFAERYNIPVASTFLAKSVINERHPLFAGIYSGVSSNGFTKDLVENSDCLLMFGVMLTDMNLCFMPAKFKKRQVVSASVGGLTVKNHAYMDVQFADFCEAIFKCEFEKREAPVLPMREKKPFEPKENTKITSARFFQQIDAILNKNMAIVADIGDTLFGAGDLTVHHNNHFLSPAFYTSMGFAIPGALGVQTAKPDVRPIVLVGDGAFQMTVAEISTLVERKLNPIIFILNNQGYTTERFLRDGGFNDIRNWNYHMVSDLFNGGCEGVQVKTEEDLHSSVLKALDSKCPFLLNVMIDKNDISPGLKRMTEALAKRV